MSSSLLPACASSAEGSTVEFYFGQAAGTGTYGGTLSDDGTSREMTLTVSGMGKSENITLHLDS